MLYYKRLNGAGSVIVGAATERFMLEHSTNIKGYPFINIFMFEARSIPSFDTLAIIIIRISPHFPPPETANTGGKTTLFLKRGGKTGGKFMAKGIRS